MKYLISSILPFLLVIAAAGPAQAQGARGRGRAEGDRNAVRARMADRYREQLGATEEEWTVIEPLINRVQQVQRETRMQRMAWRGGETDAAEVAPVQQSAAALRAALESEGTPAAVLTERIEALRAARRLQENAVRKAAEELRAVLTAQQEARLILMGVLD